MNNNVVFLGCTQGYGYKFSAGNIKTEYLIRGLTIQGDTCSVINNLCGLSYLQKDEIKNNDYTRIISYKQRGPVVISWILNYKRLFCDLKRLRNDSQNNVAILELPDFHIFIAKVIAVKRLKYKVAIISHEWGPTFQNVRHIRKLSIWLYSKLFGYFSDGILPISDYIRDKIVKFKKPILMIPITGEYKSITEHQQTENYYVYCGQADYFRIYNIIIEGFNIHRMQFPDSKLLLILSGKQALIDIARSTIKEKQLGECVFILQDVSSYNLLEIYKKALALLIPLDANNHQDQARFPQKIAEYISTHRPIVTNSVGEIPKYFVNMKSAIFSFEFSSRGIAESLNYCRQNPQKLNEIGEAGFQVGVSNFDYVCIGRKLSLFLTNL